MRKMAMVLSGVVVMVIAVSAFAQYEGPGKGPSNSTVKAVLANPVDDSYVTLRGNITSSVGDEKYMFSDGTGEILVEIDDDDFPRGVKVTPETKVEIYGEVEKKFMRKPEVDVKRVAIVR